MELFETKYEQDPDDHDLLLGRMRCLENLGKWTELHKLACEKWDNVGDDIRHKMAQTASSAAWSLNEWNSMEEYTLMIPREILDGAFYRAVLYVHQVQILIYFHLTKSCPHLSVLGRDKL